MAVTLLGMMLATSRSSPRAPYQSRTCRRRGPRSHSLSGAPREVRSMCGIPYREMNSATSFKLVQSRHQEVLAYELIVCGENCSRHAQVQAVRIKLNLFGDLHSQDAWPRIQAPAQLGQEALGTSMTHPVLSNPVQLVCQPGGA